MKKRSFSLTGALVGSFLIVAGIGATLASGKLSPRIVHAERYKLAECTEDPLSPCEGERIVVENPTRHPAELTLNCGSDFDEEGVRLPPYTRLTVEVELTIPVNFPACRISRVTFVR
jgi:hypothetical protein